MPSRPSEHARPTAPEGRAKPGLGRLIGLLAAAVVLLPFASASTDGPEVHLHIFLSSTCPHCELIERPALKELGERLQCNIQPHYYDVDSLAEYRRLVRLEERFKDTGNQLPAVFMGEHVLGGRKEIEEALEALLLQYRETGLAPLEMPPLEEAAHPGAAQRAGPAVYMAYFESPGCRECDRVDRMLRLLQSEHSALEVRRFAGESRDEQTLLEALCEWAGVPVDRRLLVPAVFLGNRALVKNDVNDRALATLLAHPPEGAASRPWEVSDQELAQARRRLARRASGVTPAAVVVGGLVDGVNPCAFATIAFLVVCLTGMGAGRRRVLSVGVGFAAGVFVAYFLTGIALWEALRKLDLLPALSRAVTWAIITAVFVLAALSFRDARRALAGNAEAMSLKLPSWLRRRINAIIARRLRARYLVVGAFALGLTVSMLEFVCTGQVYLPLIRYMTAAADTRLRGLVLLFVYDVAFVVPLVGVFGAVYFGVRSESLAAAFHRHVAAGKIALGLFFAALGGLMIHAELVGL